jgi:predicted DNA-binding transcriptional regulator AlpA
MNDEVLMFPEVCQVLRVSIRAGRRMRLQQRFPPALQLGERCLRWTSAGVREWLASRREETPAGSTTH